MLHPVISSIYLLASAYFGSTTCTLSTQNVSCSQSIENKWKWLQALERHWEGSWWPHSLNAHCTIYRPVRGIVYFSWMLTFVWHCFKVPSDLTGGFFMSLILLNAGLRALSFSLAFSTISDLLHRFVLVPNEIERILTDLQIIPRLSKVSRVIQTRS